MWGRTPGTTIQPVSNWRKEMRSETSIPASRRLYQKPAVSAAAGIALAAVIGLAIALAFFVRDEGRSGETAANVAVQSGATGSSSQPTSAGEPVASASGEAVDTNLHVYIFGSQGEADAFAEVLAGFDSLIASQGGTRLLYDLVVIDSPATEATMMQNVAELQAIRETLGAGSTLVHDYR